jgi:asparagine synthase (glutamine-hydrolysing)
MCGLVVYSGNSEKLEQFDKVVKSITHRGPDNTTIRNFKDKGTLVFHRLSIMDTSHRGDQPLIDQDALNYVVCNGEIYNYHQLYEHYKSTYHFTSRSDCEVILPLYKELGIEGAAKSLDGEYALVIYDEKLDKYFAARDPIGIRPLFYGYTRAEKKIIFASEAKAIHPFCDRVEPFPPGHYYDGAGKILPYLDIAATPKGYVTHSQSEVEQHIHDYLVKGVEKRLHSDVPLGFLLSGGLDSSLVCAIAARILKNPIVTFSVGINENPIDTKYAKIVADHLGTIHHEFLFTPDDVINVLDKLIWHLETWDITTVRASIGMYLICKYVREKTDIKVLLTGEVSDELFGYKYTDFAPSPQAFQDEAAKRIRELYIYDVLRADRCIAAHSIEARVPFSDQDFVAYVMSIPPEKKVNTSGVGKNLLRKSFEKGNYLPPEILWRDKAAFSDAVGHSMVDYLKAHAEKKYSDADVKAAAKKYPHGTPFTKESLLYRDIFEKHYPGRGGWIKDFWMPNKEWKNCDVKDPSARVLPNYGASGT